MRSPSLKAAALLAAGQLACFGQTAPASCVSPDRQIELTVRTLEKGAEAALVYSVRYAGNPVIADSRLGIDPLEQPPLGPDVKILKTQPGSTLESYRLPHGKTSQVQHPYNSLLVDAEERRGLARRLGVEFRVFNDGLAFRYHVPQQPALRELRLERELTEFSMAREGMSWPLILRDFRTSYEDDYVSLPLSGIKREALVALPFLVEVPGRAWLAITEAHLENYPGMYLTRTGGGSLTMTARLAPRPDRPEIAAVRETPFASPWRVVQIAREPVQLIESNLVTSLNPPSKIADLSWIRPGKTSWTWWSGDLAKGVDFKPGMNTPTLKHYIDFSASLGLEYALIDEGWSTNNAKGQGDLRQIKPEIDLPALLQHARSKGVKLWLWAHWEAVDRHMEEVFSLFEKWGVAGVKIDFMDRDDQWMVNFYYRAAEAAARHKLMLDFHGAYKPTGMSRTWPNVLTFEGGMGLEYIKWSARVTAAHNTVLPFTRLLAGPFDYTPGAMNNVRPDDFTPRFVEPSVPHTRAHQTALYVILESALQMLCDYPGAYQGQKETDFIRAVPAAWDETRGIAGMPGEYVVIARRKGPSWYLGAITNRSARTLEVPLAFLSAGEFQATLYADAPDAALNPKNTVVATQTVRRGGTLRLSLAPAGGAAAVFRPAAAR
jgi:alpha-glucosidase